MLPNRPRIKSLYPVYRVTEDELRIGAEPGITARVDDSDGVMSTFIDAIDGQRDLPTLIRDLRARYPEASEQDVIDGLNTLIELNFIEDADHASHTLSARELERYSRNIKFFEHFATPSTSKYSFQEKLKAAKVCVLGLGGHGSNILFQLAAVGVGHVVAVDFDRIELSNLNRLPWYRVEDVGRHKTEAAARTALAYAPDLTLETHVAQVGDDVARYARGCDLIICAIDHPYAQIDRWVNEAALALGVPCIFTSHFTMTGRYYSIRPGETGCIDCMIGGFLREDPLFERQFWALARDGRVRRAHQAVLAPNVSVLTGMIAAEAVRYLAGTQPPLSAGKMMIVDFGTMTGRVFFEWSRHADCPTCGTGDPADWPFFQELEQFSRPQGALQGHEGGA